MNPKEIIARRVAKEFKDGDVVNLGIGLPTLVANYIPEDMELILHSENGFVGIGPAPKEGEEDKDLVNAGACLSQWCLVALTLIARCLLPSFVVVT